MDKQERGLLLVEQEEAKLAIANITQELSILGHNLIEFGQKLVNQPARIVFSNAPEGLGNVPDGLSIREAYDWRSFSRSIQKAAEQIQELRKQQDVLQNVQHRL